MERIEGIDEARAAELRDREKAAADAGDDDFYTDEVDGVFIDRRNRPHVAYYFEGSGSVWLPSAVKVGDDVSVGGMHFRVIGPARGRQYFYGYNPSEYSENDVAMFDVMSIDDRVPLNTEEAPMPVVPGHNIPPEVVEPEEPSEEALALYRAEAFRKIDLRSRQIINAGFVFQNIIFSMSVEAQIRYTNMLMLAAEPTMYPLDVNSLDDTTKVSLTTPEQMQAFCLGALDHVKETVATGTIEKDKIRAMQTIQEIVDYQDLRALPSVIPVEPGQQPTS